MRTSAAKFVRPVVHMYRHELPSPVGSFFFYANANGEVCCASWIEDEKRVIKMITHRFFKSCDVQLHRESSTANTPGAEAARLLQAYFAYHGTAGTPPPTVFSAFADTAKETSAADTESTSRKRKREEVTQHAAASVRALRAQQAEMDALLRKIRIALPPDVSGFQRNVWQALHKCVPSGEVTTYKALADLAAANGSTRGNTGSSARAVGTAMHDNPICVVVPCHRVLASNGSVNGYGCGLNRKVWLLRHERAQDVDEVKLRRVESVTLVSTPESRR